MDNTNLLKGLISRKIILLILLGPIVLTALLLLVSAIFFNNEEAIIGYLENLNNNPDNTKLFFLAFSYAVYGLILLFFIAVIFFIFKNAGNKHKALMAHGKRDYCKIRIVENIHYKDDDGKMIEYKNVYITTPLGKGGVYRFPITEDVEEGDELFIVYHPVDPKYFNIAYKNGKTVIRKKAS
ncbi:hypothetical protein KJ951_04465 [Patescibacteria group bacterium]|nr:hypothetical protein [Patescibacteria group bacterium]MBU1703632.1 hypothetical protein [Patescibacteria group bacterium]MBU1953935.1 hypothetical protein [Patescibacteria group bacterium]